MLRNFVESRLSIRRTVGCNILHLEGNKIKETWSVADGLSAAVQLGVVKT
jgi:hypothetical protein